MLSMKLKFYRPKTVEGQAGFNVPKPLANLPYLSRVFASHRGSALVITIVLMLVASTLIVVGVQLLSNMNKQTQQQTLAVAEAENAAYAGLVDAANWFRRQNNTVSYFYPNAVPTPQPQYNSVDDPFAPVTNSTTKDTIDPSIGVVYQYPINGAVVKLAGTNNIWARYEVRKSTNSLTPTPVPPTPNIDPSITVHDITGEKLPSHLNGEGLIWSLCSTGYIYINNDPTLPFNQSPNKVLATAKMRTEIRKMSLSLPVTAAAICHDMSTIHVNGNGIINGGQSYYAAGAYLNYSNAAYPVLSGNGKISPSAGAVYRASQIQNWVVSNPVNIFGMSSGDVKNLADVTGDSTHPLIFGANQLVYFNGNLTYDPASPNTYYQNSYLNGKGGIIYVDNGNLTLKPVPSGQVGAYFNGVIFCNGSVTIGENNTVTGVVMAVNGITVGTGQSGTTEPAQLICNDSAVTALNSTVTNYREDRSASHTFIAVPFYQ